jgi:hypothetical protein
LVTIRYRLGRQHLPDMYIEINNAVRVASVTP